MWETMMEIVEIEGEMEYTELEPEDDLSLCMEAYYLVETGLKEAA